MLHDPINLSHLYDDLLRRVEALEALAARTHDAADDDEPAQPGSEVQTLEINETASSDTPSQEPE